MSFLVNVALAEQVTCETAIIMLDSLARDKTYGSQEAVMYMETYMCRERDFQACILYLKRKIQVLVGHGTELIKVGSFGCKELLALLCTHRLTSIPRILST